MKRLILIQSLFLLIFAFQNCARQGAPETAHSGTTDTIQKVITDTSSYTQIAYAPPLKPASQLNVNLQSGVLQLAGKSCALDAERLQDLRQLMASSQVCEVSPGSGLVCQAFSMPDIELSNGQDAIQLRPVLCQSGVILCAGADQTLRDEIQQLIENPPANCAQ